MSTLYALPLCGKERTSQVQSGIDIYSLNLPPRVVYIESGQHTYKLDKLDKVTTGSIA
jgi:predicted component of type VI protein secretion system